MSVSIQCYWDKRKIEYALISLITSWKIALVSMMNKYVGKQYLDNTSNEDRVIDAYFISHFDVSYTLKDVLFKEMTFGVRVNNAFDELYENNGYTFGYILGGQRIQENFYYPQAGRNFLLRLLIKL